MNALAFSRRLTDHELSIVSGGDVVYYYDNNRDGILNAGDAISHYQTTEGTNYLPSAYRELLAGEAAAQTSVYFSAGWAFGVGFGVEYTSANGLDVNWLAGVGAYGQLGFASDADAALETVIGGEDDIVHALESGAITDDGENVGISLIGGALIVDDDQDSSMGEP